MALQRFFHFFISLSMFLSCLPLHAQADAVASLPKPGTMVNLSTAFEPVLIKGLKVHPDDPFLFDFIVDSGNSTFKIDAPEFKAESNKLIKYFLSALTVPEKDLWVNLSPYEKDRMIAPNLGQTQMGQDMLAEDYILKQLTASMIYPEKGLGKEFWDKVYAQVNPDAVAAPIAMDAFNKVWITADRADVYEGKNTAYVTSAHLKVMLEQDYLAAKKNAVGVGSKPTHNEITDTLKQIVLPAIEKEVNEGKNFAKLRQIYNSMILASWYKMRLKNALMTQVYGNRSKTGTTINADDPKDKEAIFQRYLQAYKKGVFNFIKEEIDPKSYQTVPRKYFSGGLSVRADLVMLTVTKLNAAPTGELAMVSSPIKLRRSSSSQISTDSAQSSIRQSVALVLEDNEGLQEQADIILATYVGFNKVIIAKNREEVLRALEGNPNITYGLFDFNLIGEDHHGGDIAKLLKERGVSFPIDLQSTEPEALLRPWTQYFDHMLPKVNILDFKAIQARAGQVLQQFKDSSDAAQTAKNTISKVIFYSHEFNKKDKYMKINGLTPEFVTGPMSVLESRLVQLDGMKGVVVVMRDYHVPIISEQIMSFESYLKHPFPFVFLMNNGNQVYMHDPNNPVGIKWFRNKQGSLQAALDYFQKTAVDAAMTNGGIDLNTGSINVNKQGKGVFMQFDQAMIDRINAQGFTGVDFRIDRIVPILNLQSILDAG